MAKAYVLTTGDYSAYRIVGVFSTRELAEEARARRLNPDDNDVEEYDVDDPQVIGAEPEAGFERGPVYHASVRLAGGHIIRGLHQLYPDAYRHPSQCRIWEECMDDAYWARIRVHSPISTDHAVKVAVEKRQEWLRSRDAGAVVAKEVAGE